MKAVSVFGLLAMCVLLVAKPVYAQGEEGYFRWETAEEICDDLTVISWWSWYRARSTVDDAGDFVLDLRFYDNPQFAIAVADIYGDIEMGEYFDTEVAVQLSDAWNEASAVEGAGPHVEYDGGLSPDGTLWIMFANVNNYLDTAAVAHRAYELLC